MCGIYGQYNVNGADLALVERMARCLEHRGPDGSGTFRQGSIALGAGRLAIIDLAAGVQPLFSEDRRVAVIFNGEIYNYRALRAELEALGHVFATQTDTEVIVHGYESWGIDVLQRLRGMFAIGVWDEAEQRLLLARDRLGEKPLYYAQHRDSLLFASEIKALFEEPTLPRRVNAAALPVHLALGYTPAPDTMFEGIQKLGPGQCLVIDSRGLRKEQYYRLVMDTQSMSMSLEEASQRVRAALIEAVDMRLMSDVPLGAFLSGGLDSTGIVAMMGAAMGRPVETFTVGFAGGEANRTDKNFNVDADYARLAAQRLGTNHREILIDADPQLAELFPYLVYAMDEPLAQPSIIQTAYVAALARLNGVPVLLSGDTGDELFAGYPAYRADRILERYLQLPRLLRDCAITPLLKRLPARFYNWRQLAAKSADTDPTHRYLTWMRIIAPDRLPGLLADPKMAASAWESLDHVLAPILGQPQTRHFADRIAFAGLNLWIPEESNMRVDKMSMAMSVESRAPFEDHHLVELALRIPLGYKLRDNDFKVVLKRAVADLVPPEILARPKWGFFPPASEWLRTVFKPLVDTYLSPERVAAAGWFKPEAVTQLIEDHVSKRRYELWPLWSLLVFHLWHAMYIDCSLTLKGRIGPGDLDVIRQSVPTES